MLVILESTTYPGTTDEVVQPLLEAKRAQGRRGFLPRAFAGARRSGQPEVSTPRTSRRSSAASTPACTEIGALLLRRGARDDRAGQFDARRRDGEAAREHVPRRQHRPRQRDRADVRQAWVSTCGK